MILTEAILTFPLQQPVAIFLLVLVIILLAPLIFNRLKIPHLVGMILAGMLVGPHCFNILARDSSFEIFGQVGILYLMFLAAVEIDMFHLKQNSRAGVLFGVISFAVPMGLGVVAAHAVFGVSWTSAALIGSMYGSHTLISYPIIGRFGLATSRAVVIAVCGTIVAVLLALITLAGVVDVTSHGEFLWSSLAVLAGATVVYAVVLGFAVPRVARIFFRKVNDPVTQFIFILSVVLACSLLASLIGLEAILGAFYAGLVLNRFVPQRSALMNRLEFVGNAIFIPYFLIGVGMLINVHVIVAGWGVVWTAANMIVVALGGKWIAAWLGQKFFGMSGVGRRIMFGLTSGKAAATIAAVMVGYRYELLPEDIMNGAVLMILICCAVASICTERAAIKRRMQLADEEFRQTSGPQHTHSRQLVAVANPMTAEGLMKLAILMRHPHNDLPLTALYVRNNDDPASVAMGRNALAEAAQAAASVDLKVDTIERYDMNTVAGLINVVKERRCTDIIIGFHRRSNIVDSFYGSMIEQLLRVSNKMVTMSRCFIPVNTIADIIVVVPAKAEYETGFRLWVERVANLTAQLGCRALFAAYKETIPYIQGVMAAEGFNISHEFRTLHSWDDFIMLAPEVGDDDLLVVIGARRTSISFSADLENIPSFLSRYFSRNNIMMIYPEQFGAQMEMPAPINPLAQSIPTAPSPVLLSLRRIRDFFTPRS